MKIPFIFAISSTSLSELTSIIDGAEFFPSGSIIGVNYNSLVVDGFRYLVSILCTGVVLDKKSNAVDDTWTLVWVLPEDASFKESTKLFRKVTKNKLAKQEEKDKDENKDKTKYIAGGTWCIDDFAENFPDIANTYLRNEAGELRCPHIFAGDPLPELTAKCKYKPTDEDCINDIDADYDSVVTNNIA